jgi:hypothetical protein
MPSLAASSRLRLLPKAQSLRMRMRHTHSNLLGSLRREQDGRHLEVAADPPRVNQIRYHDGCTRVDITRERYSHDPECCTNGR